MDLEREDVVGIVLPIAIVVLFVALLVLIGQQYNADSMGSDGGLALVGAIVAFVLVMAGMGLGLAYYLHPDEPGADAEATAEEDSEAEPETEPKAEPEREPGSDGEAEADA